VQAVRLGSGDLAEHARKVRRILDDGNLRDVRILASSGLDETEIAALVCAEAPIDGFAPGTRVVISADAPYLDAAYKLVEYTGRPRHKTSEGKTTWPGRKQVFRCYDGNGCIDHDVLALSTERLRGEPLLMPVMRAGLRLGPSRSTAEIRTHTADQYARLPRRLRHLGTESRQQVHVSAELRALLAGR
jgi:nicotinate phosphoribosyltransferase